MRIHRFRCVVVCAVVLFVSSTLLAQVAGQNINMVSGTSWPAGDPFLQRQNEPSAAVSTRNSQHLLGGANDYRSVDIANPSAPNELGDAWVSVFTSTDGGDKWQSTLLPGYPQDASAIGKASPLHAFSTATDPTIRAGSNGLFYYSGLAFNRGSNAPSGVFVSVFQDQNNKGNGNGAIQTSATGAGNPFLYVSATMVDTGTSGQFLDKPWIVVDIPRTGRTATCKINGKTFSSGYVYLFYTKFNGSTNNPISQIKETESTNCGATWTQPQVLSQSSKYNQGTLGAVDPTTGNVWAMWRQRSLGNMSQPDSFLYAYSTNGGSSFSGPYVAYTFPTGMAFDQGSSAAAFRTIDVPALAVDANSRVWLAFSKRVAGPNGTGATRIMITTLAKGSSTWSTPYQADSTSPTSSVYGHQFMPSFWYAYGKLMLAWYDTRWDNQQLVATCDKVAGTCTQTHVPIPGSLLANGDYKDLFTSQVIDPVGQVRHTVDVYGALIDPSQFGTSVPAFQVSQYPFYVNVTDPNNPVIQQAKFNPPNLPEFVQGTIAFIGDYIDIAGLNMVPNGTGWKFTDATTSPVFHVSWTDNRDVIPPPYVNGVEDWSQYSPPGATSAAPSIYNPVATEANCAQGYSGDRNENVYTSRITSGLVVGFHENQKAITTSNLQRAYSLFVRNTNNPLINPSPAYYRILLGTTTAGVNGTSCSNAATGGTAIFPASAGCYLDIALLPQTTTAQTVLVTANSSSNTNIPVNVLVTQINAPGGNPNGGPQAIAQINGDPTNPNVVNPDNPFFDPTNPDDENLYSNLPNLLSGEAYDPSGINGADLQTCLPSDPNYPSCAQSSALVAAPSIAAPSIAAPSIAAPSIAAPSIAAPSIAAPSIAAPSITSVQTAAPSIVNPTTAAPSIAAPSIAAPSIVNFANAAPSITNLPDSTQVTDYSWKYNAKGNTTTSYNTQQFIRQASNFCGSNGTRCQLIAHKTYASPTVGLNSNGQSSCQLAVEVADITQANIPDPAFTTASGLNGGLQGAAVNASNNSIYLAPGQGTRLTLRVFAPSVNPIPTIPGTTIFPITPIASATTPDTGQTTPPQSLTILTAVLPVAIVGQPYTSNGLSNGTTVAIQSLGGVFSTGQTPVWSIANTSNPAPVTVPGGPYPIFPNNAGSTFTLAQSGAISRSVVTDAPGFYSFDPQVQDYAAPNQNLDAQFLNLQVNQFSISNVNVVAYHNGVANEVGSTEFMQAGDYATVAVTVFNQGPSGAGTVSASNVSASVAVNATAGGGGPTPSVTCVTTSTNPVAIVGNGSTVEFDFKCTANSGNGYVNFTAAATGSFTNGAGVVTANAVPVIQPNGSPTPGSTPPNLVVDTTNPTLTYAASTTSPSAPNWYNTPVVVPFTTNDNLAGVSTAVATSPATSGGTSAAFNGTGSLTLTTEGKPVTGVMTVTDFAFNSAAFTSLGYNIDRTPPTIAGVAAPVANSFGWNNTPVTVTFTCGDPNPLNGPAGQQSGVGSCTAPITLSTEGANQSASGTAVDNAANLTGTTVQPINIDLTNPTVSNFVFTPPVPASGWYNATTPSVSIAFTTSDNLSGVDAASTTASPVTVTGEGSALTDPIVVADKASNVLNTTTPPIKIDLTPPGLGVTAVTADGAPYTAGTWTNQIVTVTYTCSDALSGVGTLSLSTAGIGGSPVINSVNATTSTATISSNTAGLTVSASCSDVAGNTSTKNFGPVQIDTTAPTASASLSSAANVFGWYNVPVSATFTCADLLSGVASTPAPVALAASGAAQPYSGTCVDNATNTASASGAVNIDLGSPVASITTPSANQVFTLNAVATSVSACSNAVSPLASCLPVSGSVIPTGTPGQNTYSVTATNEAGTSSAAAVPYLVTYAFTGFQAPLQPAGPVATPSDSGSFTTGTHIQAIWQLQDAANAYVSDLTSLASVQALAINCDGTAASTPNTISLFANGAPAGTNLFRYDSTNHRFLFDWDTTGTAAGCYKIVVTLNDTTAWATIVHIAADTFAGFGSPLSTGSAPAAPSDSGSIPTGSMILVNWTLSLPAGGPDATPNVSLSNATVYANPACSGAAPSGALTTVLSDGSAGSFIFDSASATYTVNWDTSTFATGCYDVVITLSDQSSYATMVKLTTPAP